MPSLTRIRIPYTPRVHQAMIHKELDSHRWSVLVMHRRFGKTVMLVNHLIRSALLCSLEAPRFHYCAPFLKQAKKVSWDYVKRYTNKIPGIQYNESELRCDFPNGARLTLIGADNPEGHRGIYSDGCVFDEYGQTDPQVFTSIFRPALSDRGGWAVFSGTPNGRNHFHELLCRAEKEECWYSKVLRASETGVLSKEELYDAQYIMSEEEYEREYECSFVSGARGAYYAKQMREAEREGRIGNVPYDASQEVYTFWDLGVDDSTTVWFIQVIGKEFRFIDYYENSGQGMEHYAKTLKSKPYNYGDHYMPHDASHRSGQTGKTMKEYAEDMGIRPIIIVQRAKDSQAVINGIQAGRNILSQCWFDKHKCERGLSALESYQSEWDESKQKLGDKPCHDWTSHACLPAGEKVLLETGYKEIEKISIGEKVMLPHGELGIVTNSGISGYTDELVEIALSNGEKIRCTANHTMLTHLGLVEASDLEYDTGILISGGKLWQIKSSTTTALDIISHVVTTLNDLTVNRRYGFTELFGKSRTVRYLMVMLSTTKIAIQETMRSATFNCLRFANMPPTTEPQEHGQRANEISMMYSHWQEMHHTYLDASQKIGQETQIDGRPTPQYKDGLGLRARLDHWLKPLRVLKNGIKAQKEQNGIRNMERNVGKLERLLTSFALYVAENTVRFILTKQSSVAKIVKKSTVSVKRQPVYNLTVEHHNCYVVSSMLVSNSDAFRTFSVGYAPKRKVQSVTHQLQNFHYAGVW